MEQHFGQWLKRVRDRSQLSQKIFANALGLKSIAAIGQMEDKAEQRLRGGTLEALCAIVGVPDGQNLYTMWTRNIFPDPENVRLRASTRAARFVEENEVELRDSPPFEFRKITEALARMRAEGRLLPDDMKGLPEMVEQRAAKLKGDEPK